MNVRFFAACLSILLAGCGSFPTEHQLAHRFERENIGRKVVHITASTKTQPIGPIGNELRVDSMDFQIFSTNSGGKDPRTDRASYWQAAEAVVHDQSWK
jgi:hypothetical protein